MHFFGPVRNRVAKFLSTFFAIQPEPYSPITPIDDTLSAYLSMFPATPLETRYAWTEEVLQELATLHAKEGQGIAHAEVRVAQGGPGRFPRAVLLHPEVAYAPFSLPPAALSRAVGVFLSQAFSQSHAENAFPPILAELIHGCLMGRRTVDDARDILWHFRATTKRDGSLDWSRAPPWIPATPPVSETPPTASTTHNASQVKLRSSMGSTARTSGHDTASGLRGTWVVLKGTAWRLWLLRRRNVVENTASHGLSSRGAAPPMSSRASLSSASNYEESEVEEGESIMDPGPILVQARVSRDAPLSVVLEGEEYESSISGRFSTSMIKDEGSSLLPDGERLEFAALTPEDSAAYRLELQKMRVAVAELNSLMKAFSRLLEGSNSL